MTSEDVAFKKRIEDAFERNIDVQIDRAFQRVFQVDRAFGREFAAGGSQLQLMHQEVPSDTFEGVGSDDAEMLREMLAEIDASK